MTKKDFDLIASVIEDMTGCYSSYAIAEKFSNVLANKNPRFNKDKFLQACRLEMEEHYGQHIDNGVAYCADCEKFEDK